MFNFKLRIIKTLILSKWAEMIAIKNLWNLNVTQFCLFILTVKHTSADKIGFLAGFYLLKNVVTEVLNNYLI